MNRVLVALALIMVSTPVLSEQVIASYYGNELRGHRTANGEVFNPGGLTAAHKSLPFGTCLLVSYHGRSVQVRVNDRGPFVRGRSLDLSRGAARVLGMGSTSSVTMKRCGE